MFQKDLRVTSDAGDPIGAIRGIINATRYLFAVGMVVYWIISLVGHISAGTIESSILQAGFGAMLVLSVHSFPSWRDWWPLAFVIAGAVGFFWWMA